MLSVLASSDIGASKCALSLQVQGSVERLRYPNYAGVYSAELDGKKRVVRIRLGNGSPGQVAVAQDFARRLSDSGWGVPFIGISEVDLETALSRLGLMGTPEAQEDVEQYRELGISSIEVYDFVEGIEFKLNRRAPHRASPFPLSQVNRARVYRQIVDFVSFCNREGILIADDFQYFVTSDSKIRVFDYDLYHRARPDRELAKENRKRLRSTLRFWASPVAFQARKLWDKVSK